MTRRAACGYCGRDPLPGEVHRRHRRDRCDAPAPAPAWNAAVHGARTPDQAAVLRALDQRLLSVLAKHHPDGLRAVALFPEDLARAPFTAAARERGLEADEYALDDGEW